MWFQRINTWLDETWVADRPISPSGVNTSIASKTLASRATLFFWLVLPFVVFYKTYTLSLEYRETDDFANLYQAIRRFVQGLPVYSEDYATTDPHFLYNPGSTLLLSPLGYIHNYDIARILFILINAVAIIIAMAVITKLFSFSLTQFVWPLLTILIFLTEGSTHTLQFGNINGLILLGITVFLWGFIRGHSLLAGLAIGCAIVFKPMLLPIVLLTIITRRWTIAVTMLLTPVVLNVVAWPLVPQAGDYLTKVVPYLKITRPYFNVSIPGVEAMYGLPSAFYYVWWFIVAVSAGVALVVLGRWRFTDPLLWLVSSTSLILVAVPTLSNLGQQYYSIFSFPLILTVFHQRSLAHNPFVAFSMLAFYCYSNYSIAYLTVFEDYQMIQCTLAWSLFIISSAVVVVSWWRAEQSHHRRSHDGALHSSLRGRMA